MSDPATVSISMPRVHTLQVTVRTLRIGTKQVTQSVFRQLPRRSVWDTMTGMLRGQPWGTVNYFWGDCSTNHLHVVWQQGERLFRDCVYPPQSFIPEGISQAAHRLTTLEADLQEGALFVLAWSVWREGLGLTPLTPGTVFQVTWPCGVQTRVVPPKPHVHGNSTLAEALARIYQDRSAHALEYRERQYQTSTDITCPPGEGWQAATVQKTGPAFSAPGYRWSRWKQETETAWARRTRERLTKLYAELERQLLETSTLWDGDGLPQSANAARDMVNETAEQWRLETAATARLRQQFMAVYAQLSELDQLFIAV